MGLRNSTGKSRTSGSETSGTGISWIILTLAFVAGGLWALLGGGGGAVSNDTSAGSQKVSEYAETNEHAPGDTYVAIEMRSAEQSKVASSLIYEFSKGTPGRKIDVDELRGDGIANVYSGSLDRMALNEISNQVRHGTTKSSGQALVAAYDRVRRLIESKPDRPQHLYIITEGTNDPKVLEKLQKVSKEIGKIGADSSKARIYLMGLNPDMRIATIDSLHSINDLYGGSCAQNYAECRELIEKSLK